MIKDVILKYLNLNIFIYILYSKMLGKVVRSMFPQFTIYINNSKLNNRCFLRKKDLIFYYQIISNSKIFSLYQFYYSHIISRKEITPQKKLCGNNYCGQFYSFRHCSYLRTTILFFLRFFRKPRIHSFCHGSHGSFIISLYLYCI